MLMIPIRFMLMRELFLVCTDKDTHVVNKVDLVSIFYINIEHSKTQEADASRHHRFLLMGNPETHRASLHIGTEGLKGALNRALILPTGVSLSVCR